jgi:hypothetical protein
MVVIQCKVVVAGTLTATFNQGAPFNLVKRMTFGNNNAFQIRNLSGWSWYKWIRSRFGIDPIATDNNAAYSGKADNLVSGSGTWTAANNPTAASGVTDSLGISNLNTTGFLQIVPGATVTASGGATYVFNVALPIPISYNEAGDIGMIVLQQNALVYSLGLQWGQWAQTVTSAGFTNDLMTCTAATAASVTVTCSATVGIEWFEVVDGVGQLVSMFMGCNDMTGPVPVSGTNLVLPPQNDFYSWLQLEIINNGYPVNPSELSNISFAHSGNIIDYQDDALIRYAKNYYQHRLPPMNGTIEWDLGLRRGLITRRDTLDVFNDMNVTNLNLSYNWAPQLGVSNPVCNFVYEYLRMLNQGA